MNPKTPAEYVNPYIGTIGHLLTSTRPVTALPHSWARIFPTVTPNVMDYYTAEKAASFPAGPLELAFAPQDAANMEDAVSRFDVGAVDSHPYSMTVCLEDTDVTVSGTTAMHSFVYCIVWKPPGEETA